MINCATRNRLYHNSRLNNNSDFIGNLAKSRNLFNIQTVQYDLLTVTTMDMDSRNTFLLVGLSNGGVDLMEVEDPHYGNISNNSRFSFSQFNLNRVQWSPTNEQFFSMLDNHDLYLVDPVEMRVIERYDFGLKTNWSEWNPNDRKVIAVCCSKSNVRLVDIRSGSSAQTVILGAPSRLASHRATRCLWSHQDMSCLIVGDNEGYLHLYDTRHSSKPLLLAGEERGQISGMSFTRDHCSIITSQGTENHLVQWTYEECKLKSHPNKFQKRKIIPADMVEAHEAQSLQKDGLEKHSSKKLKLLSRKDTRRVVPLPVDAYLRCQFHITDQHILCPVPKKTTKSKEIYIYEIGTGRRIKTIKSDGILNQGVYSVTSLIPESLSIFIGGRGRLRVWTIDEDNQRKKEEKLKRYHQTRWESDDEA